MGQKSHPRGFRLAVNRRWRSRWFEARRKNYTQRLHEDIKLRAMVFAKLDSAGVSDVVIERAANKVMLYIYSARPGLVIGKKGAGIEGLKKDLQGISQSEIFINIREVRKAECDPRLVAVNVGLQLERRVAFRRAMKKAVQTALKFGAKGIRIACSGRLGGGEMARYEWYLDGRVPLHTLRAEIDYGFYEARTTYGTIGVKCWIFKGEVLPESAAAA